MEVITYQQLLNEYHVISAKCQLLQQHPEVATEISGIATMCYIIMCYIISVMKKAAQNSSCFGCLKVIHSHNYSCNFHLFSIIHQEAIIQLLLEIAISPNVLKPGFVKFSFIFQNLC